MGFNKQRNEDERIIKDFIRFLPLIQLVFGDISSRYKVLSLQQIWKLKGMSKAFLYALDPNLSLSITRRLIASLKKKENK